MYCPNCGAQNVDEAKFCGECGKVLASGPKSNPDPPQTNPPHSKKEAVSTELKAGITIGTIIIPLLGLIMGWLYMRDENPEKKAAGRLWLYTGIGMFLFYIIYLSGDGF